MKLAMLALILLLNSCTTLNRIREATNSSPDSEEVTQDDEPSQPDDTGRKIIGFIGVLFQGAGNGLQQAAAQPRPKVYHTQCYSYGQMVSCDTN